MLPNFLHIGAAKCASSWLWNVYKEHPDVYVPEHLDNVNFFVSDYRQGLQWYERTYFSDWSDQRAIGETTNSYMLVERALERIERDLPNVKLTMTLRNPIDRAFIQWAHFSKRRFRPEQRMAFENGLSSWTMFRLWMEPGMYASHLKKVYRHFPKERVLVNFYDDLVDEPAQFLRRFLLFLGVDPDFQPSILNTIVGFPGPEQSDTEDHVLARGFSESVREEMRQIFRGDLEALQELCGRDLSHWK